ncbi:hypothetical protein E4L58_00760 [Mycoplasmopsis agalactiae]|nr:hypothetical protein E4L58_00760 [Mycoplasmopsis agalactiae]
MQKLRTKFLALSKLALKTGLFITPPFLFQLVVTRQTKTNTIYYLISKTKVLYYQVMLQYTI